ncbi:class I SAM-dependent methyltransferase [Cellulomonas sp. NPDC057328]|uniref:class I SAM-dependent methyltransferase n=1 Tax=Cellulomonas sp. NPDC057328 TaxID=3346101 RepID=UPI00362DBECE
MVTRERPAGDVDYERHGQGYAVLRRPDLRIEARVHAALGAARTVLNVGAGTGSYEPADRYVLAVEPSATMRAQRPATAAPAVDATAERLPFDDDSVDAAMAMVTIHQWTDVEQGLREMRRVSRGPVVVLTVDAPALRRFWLADYFPEVIALDETRFPAIDRVVDVLAAGSAEVRVDVVPVPLDCVDGFGEAFYGRPEAFLDPEVRAATSGFGLADAAAVQRGVDRLADDLAGGAWDRAHGHLRTQAEYEGAMRLVIATP